MKLKTIGIILIVGALISVAPGAQPLAFIFLIGGAIACFTFDHEQGELLRERNELVATLKTKAAHSAKSAPDNLPVTERASALVWFKKQGLSEKQDFQAELLEIYRQECMKWWDLHVQASSDNDREEHKQYFLRVFGRLPEVNKFKDLDSSDNPEIAVALHRRILGESSLLKGDLVHHFRKSLSYELGSHKEGVSVRNLLKAVDYASKRLKRQELAHILGPVDD